MYNWGKKLLDTESPDKMWKLSAFFVCVCVCGCVRVCVREREREGEGAVEHRRGNLTPFLQQ